jgi:hypothetical protein
MGLSVGVGGDFTVTRVAMTPSVDFGPTGFIVDADSDLRDAHSKGVLKLVTSQVMR